MPLVNTKVPLNERVAMDKVVNQIDDIPEKCQKDYAGVDEVGVAVKVISITDMDMASGTFTADFNVNIAWKGAEENKPVVQFYNLQETKCDFDEADPKKGKKGWDWFYRIRCNAVFRQDYDLHRFPFDEQDLQIDVRLKKACRLTHLPWGPDGDACSCDPRAVSDDFDLIDAKVKHSYLPSYKFGELGGYDPEAALVFTVVRKPMYWIVSYGVISSVIASLMVCTYALSAESVSDRLGVAMTLVLTITATKYMMMDKLPGVAYLTFLDIHILLCCLFLFVLTIEVSLADFFGHEKLAAFEKMLFLPAASFIWVSYHAWLFLWIYIW